MTDSHPPCPLCGQELLEARAIHICHACHSTVMADGVKVSATGEFRVDQLMAAMAEGGAEPVAAPADAETAGVCCSWCGKSEGDVRKLLSRGQVHICNECVALCAAVMNAELGDEFG